MGKIGTKSSQKKYTRTDIKLSTKGSGQPLKENPLHMYIRWYIILGGFFLFQGVDFLTSAEYFWTPSSVTQNYYKTLF